MGEKLVKNKYLTVTKIFFSIIGLILAICHLMGLVDSKKSFPFMFTALSIVQFSSGIDAYRQNKKLESIASILTGMFILGVTITITFDIV